ncbi:unnamed protein product, partial [Meganyctiphanes norvegica]
LFTDNMGKNTINNKKKKLAKLRRKARDRLNLDDLSIEEIIEKVGENIDQFQYTSAQVFCQEALRRDPDHVAALEASAKLCLEVDNIDGARQCLGRAITVQPESGYSKYVTMAQLMSGKEALQCYMKGTQLLQAQIAKLLHEQPDKKEGLNGETIECTKSETVNGITNGNINGGATSNSSSSSVSISEMRRELSTTFCSIAELFMTDLCDEEQAEEQCRSNINKATEVDSSNPEAYQQMASFLLVKQEPEEAKTFINKSLNLWLPKYKELDDGKAEAGSFDPVEVCPLSLSARMSAARILIELESHQEALDVLECCLGEDDEAVDVWYLMGWSYYLRGEEFRDSAQHHLTRAMQIHKKEPCEDTQLVEHLQDLLSEIGYEPQEEEAEVPDIENIDSDSDQEEQEQMDIE